MELTPAVEGEPTKFARKEYDVTDSCVQALCLATCPMHWLPLFMPGLHGTKKFILEPEEAVFEVKCCLCDVTTRRPYGELGSVDRSNCCCFVGVTSGLTKDQPICPGSGCDAALVDEIVAELKARMKQRGDTGNIQRAEATLEAVTALRAEVADMKGDMQLIMQHLGVKPKEMIRA